MSGCTNNYAIQLDNYTGQSLTLVMIKVKRDSKGKPATNLRGQFKIAAKSDPVEIPPSTGTAAGQYSVINGFYPDYDGLSAITADGKYTVTVGTDYAADPCYPISWNSYTDTCKNWWVNICSYDGTNYKCLSGDGTEFTNYESEFPDNMKGSFNNNAVVSPGGTYYGYHVWDWGMIILVLIILAIIIAVIIVVYKKYKK